MFQRVYTSIWDTLYFHLPSVIEHRGYGLQIWRVAANMLNKQSWTADRGDPPAWGLVEGLTTPHRKKETYEPRIAYRVFVGKPEGKGPHSPTLTSLYLRHNSFFNPSVASPTSQLILQPLHCFTYVTGTSPMSPGEPPIFSTWIKSLVITWIRIFWYTFVYIANHSRRYIIILCN